MMTDSLIPSAASWVVLTLGAVSLAAVLAASGGCFLSVFRGLRIATAAGARRCEELLYGVYLYSVVGFGGLLVGLRLLSSFTLFVTLLALAALVARSRWPRVTSTGLSIQAAGSREWWAPGLVIVGTAIWTLSNVAGLEVTAQRVTLIPWQDTFFHARELGNFARFRGDFGTLHWSMYGESIEVYHHGNYIVAALLADLTGLAAIQVATSFYPFLGMLLTGAAMIVLAQSTLGTGTAVLGVLLLFFVPDPSAFIPGFTRLFSYFFFQQVGVGGAYAVGLIGLSMAVASAAVRTGRIALTLWSGVLFLVAALFKAQIVIAFGVFYFVALAATLPGVGRGARAAAVTVVLIAYAMALSVLANIPNAPTMGLALDGVRRLLRLGPDAQSGVPAIFFLPAAMVVVVAVTYGLLTIPLVLLGWRSRRVPSLRPVMALLALAIGAHLLVRLLLADNKGSGDAFEVSVKTFVLPYFVVVFGLAVLLRHAIGDPRQFWLRHRISLQLTAVTGLVATLGAGYRLQVWPSASAARHIDVPMGLFKSAAMLRERAGPGELVQLCSNDEFNQLASLAERPVYVAKLMVNAEPYSAAERHRFARLDAMMRQDDVSGMTLLARENRIGWLVMTPNCRAGWESGTSPAYSADGYRVYRVSHTGITFLRVT